MSEEPPFRLIDAELAYAAAANLFEITRQRLDALLPITADIRHVGSTAIPGCLTKGDLDIVVRVGTPDFAAADAVLASQFSRNEGSLRSETFSSFEDPDSQPHLGIQLTVIDGPQDFFHRFTELLRHSPQLRDDYNALKRRYDGAAMADYRAAKDIFIGCVLAAPTSVR